MKKILLFFANLFDVDLIETKYVSKTETVVKTVYLTNGEVEGDVYVKGNLVATGSITAEGDITCLKTK